MHTNDTVEEWIERLKETFGEKFDKDDLKLSGHAVRNSMGPSFLGQLVSLT